MMKETRDEETEADATWCPVGYIQAPSLRGTPDELIGGAAAKMLKHRKLELQTAFVTITTTSRSKSKSTSTIQVQHKYNTSTVQVQYNTVKYVTIYNTIQCKSIQCSGILFPCQYLLIAFGCIYLYFLPLLF